MAAQPTLRLEEYRPGALLAPARMNVFGDVLRVRRGKASARLCAIRVELLQAGWQGWNPDGAMEAHMARLPGSGSFYWPCAWRAYLAARRVMRECPEVSQVAIETISGQPIARVYR